MTTATMTRGLRRRAVLAAALAAVGAGGAARAQTGGDLVSLAVVNRESGDTLRVWRHNGRAYVAGRPGARYGLRVTNNTGGRVLVVMSVDGINVLTGQTASHRQRGYVFEPYQSYDVSGWRKSDEEVAAFTFAPLPRSYAARTGRPGDVGVIGVAAFREKVAPPIAMLESQADQSRLDEVVVSGSRLGRAPAAPAMRPEEKLGTGHGARERSVVASVAFERATSAPQFVRQIEYDTYENLAALGVIRRPLPERRPRPFPASGAGYVPDPPGGF